MLDKVTCPHCDRMTYKLLKCQKCGVRLEAAVEEIPSAEPAVSATHTPSPETVNPVVADLTAKAESAAPVALPETVAEPDQKSAASVAEPLGVKAASPVEPASAAEDTGITSVVEPETEELAVAEAPKELPDAVVAPEATSAIPDSDLRNEPTTVEDKSTAVEDKSTAVEDKSTAVEDKSTTSSADKEPVVESVDGTEAKAKEEVDATAETISEPGPQVVNEAPSNDEPCAKAVSEEQVEVESQTQSEEPTATSEPSTETQSEKASGAESEKSVEKKAFAEEVISDSKVALNPVVKEAPIPVVEAPKKPAVTRELTPVSKTFAEERAKAKAQASKAAESASKKATPPPLPSKAASEPKPDTKSMSEPKPDATSAPKKKTRTLADLIKEARSEKLKKVFDAETRVVSEEGMLPVTLGSPEPDSKVEDPEADVSASAVSNKAPVEANDSKKTVMDPNGAAAHAADEAAMKPEESLQGMLKGLDTLVTISKSKNEPVSSSEEPATEGSASADSSDVDEADSDEQLGDSSKGGLLNEKLLKFTTEQKRSVEKKKAALAKLESSEFEDLRLHNNHADVTQRMKDTSWFSRAASAVAGDADESAEEESSAPSTGRMTEKRKGMSAEVKADDEFPNLSDRKQAHQKTLAKDPDEKSSSDVEDEAVADVAKKAEEKPTIDAVPAPPSVAPKTVTPMIHKRPVLAIKKPDVEDQVKLIVSITKSGVDPESALAACLIEHPALAAQYAEFVRKKPMLERTRINNSLNNRIVELTPEDSHSAFDLLNDYIHAEVV